VTSSPTVASWDLGLRLRAKRNLLGLSGSEVAETLGMSVQFLSAVEHGKKKLPEDKLVTLLASYEFDDEEAAELHALREQASRRGWWAQFSALFSDELLRLFGFEHGAESVRAYDNGLMNGLLQTEEYAAAIIAAGSPNIRLAEVDRRVAARLMRQRRLTADVPLHLTAIMSESTIRQQVGGPKVLERQLRHLLDLIERLPDTLDVRAVPYTATGHHAMGGSSFNLMTFSSAMLPTLTWQETVTSTQLIEDPLTVREYSLAYAEVKKAALDRHDSVDVITQVAMELS
jgi:transcriptional regulator with XRE-family HTH domain